MQSECVFILIFLPISSRLSSFGIVPKSGKLSTSSYHRVGEEKCTDNHHHSRSHNIIIYQLDTPYHVDFPSQTTGLPMIVRRRPPDRRWHHLNQLQQRQPPLPLLLQRRKEFLLVLLLIAQRLQDNVVHRRLVLLDCAVLSGV